MSSLPVPASISTLVHQISITVINRIRKFMSLMHKSITIIMVFLIVLLFLFIGIGAVAIFHHFDAGGASHSGRPLLLVDSTESAYSMEEIQRFLPRLKYANGGSLKNECAVCLDCLADGEYCRSLPACGHVFHASCVDKWLTEAASCPICRTRIRLDSGANSSKMGECKILSVGHFQL
ncbi:hypothetical protein NMG60_11005781 [Bertholletia excelsa]